VQRDKLQQHIAVQTNDIPNTPEVVTTTRIQNTEHPRPTIRAKAKRPFRAIKCQFEPVKMRFKGLVLNTSAVNKDGRT